MKQHMEYYCKYNRAVTFPAVIWDVCTDCDAPLCPTCGYKRDGLLYCEECHRDEVKDKFNAIASEAGKKDFIRT